jgi:hypothetical protein
VGKLVKGEVAIEFVKSPRNGNKVFSAFSTKMFEQVWSVFDCDEVREWWSARIHCYPEGTRRTGVEKMCYRAKVVGFLDKPWAKGAKLQLHNSPIVGCYRMV